MGIGLLAPLFLAGLLALGVPLLVHLVHRERKEPLAFPSLMFLRRVPFRSARRQRINHWLLFLLRSAAVLLLAGAFARPWLKRPPAAVAHLGRGKDIVVMVDRSYSMSAGATWQNVRRAVRSALASAAANDRIAVIGFDDRAELLVRLEEPRARAERAIEALRPGAGSTRFAPAFKLAASVLANSTGPAQIVMITDLQRNGWRNMERVAVPANTAMRVVDVRAGRIQDIAVTNVQLARSSFAGKQRVAPGARVINRGDAAISATVELRINDRIQQTRTVSVAPHDVTTVDFAAIFANGEAGDIRIGAKDDVALDDVAYFTTGGNDALSVQLISGDADAAFYFENALTAADASGLTVRQGRAPLSSADLKGTDVLVFLDSGLPGGAVGSQVEEFVRAGGGVLVIGAQSRGAHPLLPVRNTSVVERGEPASVVSIDDAHPIFDPLRATVLDQFAGVRLSRHVRSEALPDASVVARFDDGSPALVDRRIGRGHVLFWASSFSRRAGDLVLQPVFVPFVRRMVAYLAAAVQTQHSYVVGNVIDINTFVPPDRDAVVVTPSRERVRMPPSPRARTLRITEPGIYQIRGVGQTAATQSIAANIDASESELSTLRPEMLNGAIAPHAGRAIAAVGEPVPIESEQQQSLWWYLLITVFALLIVESVLGNRTSSAWRA